MPHEEEEHQLRKYMPREEEDIHKVDSALFEWSPKPQPPSSWKDLQTAHDSDFMQGPHSTPSSWKEVGAPEESTLPIVL
jgi:hypothetical protein